MSAHTTCSNKSFLQYRIRSQYKMNASKDEIESIYDPPLDYSEVLREVRESCPRQASSRPSSVLHASQVADLMQMQSSLVDDLITTTTSSRGAATPSWKTSLFFWRRFKRSQAAAAAKHPPAPPASSKPHVIKPAISGVSSADQRHHPPPCKRVKSGPIYNTSDYANYYSAEYGYGSIAANSGSATPTSTTTTCKPTSKPLIHSSIPYFQLRDAPPRVSTSRLPLYIVS